MTLKKYLGLAILSTSLLFTLPSYAADNSGSIDTSSIVTAINTLGTNLTNVMVGIATATFNTLTSLDFTPMPTAAATATANQAMANSQTTTDATNTSILNNAMGYFINPGQAVSPNNVSPLFGPTGYTTSQQTAAQNLINQIATLPSYGLPALSARAAKATTNQKVLEFNAAKNAYVAAETMALNNLANLYAQRVVQDGLGTSAGLTGSQADLSPLQLAQYNATNRISNPTWYAQIESASPAQVRRETLYVLAGIQKELFQNRLLQQRILATQSALLLNTLSTTGLEKLQTLQGAANAAATS